MSFTRGADPSMLVVFDTSVLVAALVEQHPMHDRAFPWLRRAQRGETDARVTAHSLAELYAVLTTLPVRPRISPGMARRLVRESVEKNVRVEEILLADYRSILDDMAELDLSGGVIYDALAAQVTRRLGADALLTFNAKDFQRVWPQAGERVQEPK